MSLLINLKCLTNRIDNFRHIPLPVPKTQQGMHKITLLLTVKTTNVKIELFCAKDIVKLLCSNSKMFLVKNDKIGRYIKRRILPT